MYTFCSELAQWLRGLFYTNKVRLVMTLLVRDEVDIIDENIKYHLENGVDMIVVIDNGSKDGTRDILDKYVKKGVLFYEVEDSHTFEQDKWVTRLIGIALKKYNATHVINCDADEFWTSKYGNLKRSIAENYFCDVIYVPVINFLPPIDKRKVGFKIRDFVYYVFNTISCPGEVGKRVSSELLMYTYPEKVITSSKVKAVGYGNDSVISKGHLTEKRSSSIFIRHYPIRSFSQFVTKVVNGGSSYEKNPIDNPSTGWHWKAWYKTYKSGRISQEYDRLSCQKTRESLLKKGDIRKYDA